MQLGPALLVWTLDELLSSTECIIKGASYFHKQNIPSQNSGLASEQDK